MSQFPHETASCPSAPVINSFEVQVSRCFTALVSGNFRNKSQVSSFRERARLLAICMLRLKNRRNFCGFRRENTVEITCNKRHKENTRLIKTELISRYVFHQLDNLHRNAEELALREITIEQLRMQNRRRTWRSGDGKINFESNFGKDANVTSCLRTTKLNARKWLIDSSFSSKAILLLPHFN